MKVDGTGKTGGAGKTGRKTGTSKSDGSFSDFIAAGPGKPEAGGATNAIVQVDALLAVQGAEDPAERKAKKRMHMRAETILDKLDTIRMAMLGGTLTVGHMVDIADVVASHRENIADPELTALMDEVDLRAQVELAKLRMGLKHERD